MGSRRNLLSGIWQWVILGTPDLNGISRTSLIVAAVTWSLRYEWFFYLALPLIALLVGVIAPLPYLALSCASLYFLPQWWELKDYHEMFFLGGIVASLLVRSTIFCKIARTSVSSFVIVLCLVSIVSFCSPAYDLCILLLLSLVFALIAGGNDLFGLLTQPFSRLLGEMSYSVYLLHGMILYVLFNFIVGCNYAKSVTPFVYWLLIDCSVPFLIVLSYLIFRFVELPPMKLTFQVSNWLQKRVKLELPKGSWR